MELYNCPSPLQGLHVCLLWKYSHFQCYCLCFLVWLHTTCTNPTISINKLCLFSNDVLLSSNVYFASWNQWSHDFNRLPLIENKCLPRTGLARNKQTKQWTKCCVVLYTGLHSLLLTHWQLNITMLTYSYRGFSGWYKWFILLYQIGSPTALANLDVENKLRQKASSGTHGIYIPSGALWGGSDIKRMADRGTLKV